MEAALQDLPSTEGAAFDSIIEQARGTKGFDLILAPVLSWIYHAKRRLKMDEICELLLFLEAGHLDRIGNNVYTTDEIVKTCGSLIIHEKLGGVVRFCHATVEEWLPKSTLWTEVPSHVSIARTCINYLGLGVFDEPCLSEASLSERLKSFKFARYAVEYWGQHTKGLEMEVKDEVFKTFRSQRKRESVSQIEQFDAFLGTVCISNRVSLLHILCENGLNFICSAFKERGFDLDDLYIPALVPEAD